MKNALVLSGGGAKGAFQIGALEVLIERKRIDFQVLCGVSVGALNAAALAQAPVSRSAARSQQNLITEFRKLRKLWLKKIAGNRSIYTGRPGGTAGIIGGADSIYDPEGLRKLLKSLLNPQRLRRSGRVLKIGMVNLDTGRYESVDPRNIRAERIRDYVLASATMPYYFPPVEIADDWWADGGLRNITPLADAFKDRPRRIYAIFATPLGRDLPTKNISQGFLSLKANAFTFLGRTVEILVDEVYNNDVDGARDWNEVLETWKKVRRGLTARHPGKAEMDRLLRRRHAAQLIVIQPRKEFVSDSLEFKPRAIRAAYDHGKEVARQI